MQTIRTQWHKLLPLIKRDAVYYTAEQTKNDEINPGGKLCPHWSYFDIGAKNQNLHERMLVNFIQQMDPLPKFAFDVELLSLSRDTEYNKSLRDMKIAGVLRLPFPAMIVEWSAPPHYHAMVLLRDCGYKEQQFEFEDSSMLDHEFPFYGYSMRIHKDPEGEYIVLSPGLQLIDLMDNAQGELCVSSRTLGNILTINDGLQEHFGKVHEKTIADVYTALFGSLLLMNTLGVGREVIECNKLNKKRVLSNKPPIPRHTYIHIARVYRSGAGDQTDEYTPRKSPRPHWRRGHLRSVRTGHGRTGFKHVYIQPRLVALASDVVDPVLPTYRVMK